MGLYCIFQVLFALMSKRTSRHILPSKMIAGLLRLWFSHLGIHFRQNKIFLCPAFCNLSKGTTPRQFLKHIQHLFQASILPQLNKIAGQSGILLRLTFYCIIKSKKAKHSSCTCCVSSFTVQMFRDLQVENKCNDNTLNGNYK